MTLEGLRYLGRLAQSVPKNGTIVEIGPLYGSSTWVLSKNADPSVTIYSIDTWDPQPWIPRRLPDALPFSIDAYKHYIKDCPNVVPIQGWSPSIVADWDKPIDMFFDDATHGDPGFSENVNFFLPFMKQSGIVCGDDFASGWPDIVRIVNQLARKWEVRPEVSGRVWSIMAEGASTVADHIGSWDKNDLSVVLGDGSGTVYNGAPHMWVGPIHQNSAVTSIMVEKVFPESQINGMMQCRLMDGSETDWIEFGKMTEFDMPINNVRFMITNSGETNTGITYQACELHPSTVKTQNTKAAKNGEWIKKDANSVVCGVRVLVESTDGSESNSRVVDLNANLTSV